MFLAEMGIHTEIIIEGDYTAKYKLKDLLKKYAEQCNIANVSQAKRTVCPDCFDTGELRNDKEEIIGTCPCHY